VARTLAEAHDLERRLHALPALAAAELREQERKLHVLRGREHRHQIVELEDEAHIGRAPGRQLAFAQPVDALAVEHDLAAGGPVDAAKHVEQRRLARTRRPHDRDEIAARDAHVEMIEDRDGLLALHEALGDACQADE